MSRRVYLPLVRSDLATVARTGAVAAGSPVFAVTDAARASAARPDEEELEFDAMCAALDAATQRRHASGERRVVVSADVPEVTEVEGLQVSVAGAVPLSQVVSFHVEEGEGASEGDGYDDLLWYDVTELEDLVD